MNEQFDDEQPITMKDLARETGRSLRSIQRAVRDGLIPVWPDPVLRRKVTSLAAIARVRQLTAEQAQQEFIQRRKLNR